MALAPELLAHDEIRDQRDRFLVRYHAGQANQLLAREQAQPKRVCQQTRDFFRRVMAGPITLLHQGGNFWNTQPGLIVSN
jgi:hypothetical protein